MQAANGRGSAVSAAVLVVLAAVVSQTAEQAQQPPPRTNTDTRDRYLNPREPICPRLEVDPADCPTSLPSIPTTWSGRYPSETRTDLMFNE